MLLYIYIYIYQKKGNIFNARESNGNFNDKWIAKNLKKKNKQYFSFSLLVFHAGKLNKMLI